MQKRKSSERVSAFYRRVAIEESQPLRAAIAAWLEPLSDRIGSWRPALPEGVEDRPAEIWEPLLAIAEVAGGGWAERARAACIAFVFSPSGYSRPVGLDLLADIREVMRGRESISTSQLLHALTSDQALDWDYTLGSRKIADLLRPFDVVPKNLRIGSDVLKGYRVAGPGGLGDAWERHLGDDQHDATAATPATEGTPMEVEGSAANRLPQAGGIARVADVADENGTACPSVAQKWLLGEDQELAMPRL